ncbi:MAG: hypothetical protein MK188_08590 [Gammaproteobacteria bacterium]|nr:hypothetical protein [Gammaproteobacteria bacterium]
MKKQVKARIARLKKQSILVILIGIIVTSISTVSANQTRSGRALLSSGNLSKQQVDLLVLQLAGKPHKDFRDFCLSIYNSSRIMLTGQQKNAIARFALKQELSGPQREIIFRILGIYSQLKYGGEAIRSLGDLVEIPTVSSRRGSRAQFSKAGKVLKEKSQKFGLKFQSLKHGGYLMSFPWRKPEGASVAIYTRLGVHEADEQKWRLNDGRRVDPYKMTKVGSKFYGRGTQSNKNAIVAAMYAMRVIVEENIRLFNDIKLIVDVEKGFDYYVSQTESPMYFASYDGNYPVELPKNSADFAQSLWVKALMAVALESLDMPNQAIPASFNGEGAMHAKVLQFGLTHPKKNNLTSSPLEHMDLNSFLLDLQIVTEMIVRTGQMRRLE